MTAIVFSQSIGPVPLTCVVREKHSSNLEITQIPIETGAKVTDHAVVMPKQVTLDVGSENAAATFDALVRFQESRIPFNLVTGLKVYSNMLIKNIEPERDSTYSTVLKAKVDLQEVIMVDTAYAADPNGDNSKRGKPGGKKSTRAASPSSTRSGDATTAARSSGTVQPGDNPSTTYPDTSVLKNWLGADP